ncbi:MAG: sigma-70 family RNA polymerase sigma factor [Prevotella sp.]|nr:sigma-70 family RNA polymerase sigma factor [Prevotella sp.]
MEPKEQEFTSIVKEHKSTIYTVCYMFSKDADEVNDLFQEILLNMWKGFDGFQGRSNIKTWIYKVALNTCITIDRKKKKRNTVELSLDINLYEDNDSDTKQIKLLYDRINKLGPFDRAIILLWLDNMPYDEIGAVVGISPKNVSVRLVRIKEQLKNL